MSKPTPHSTAEIEAFCHRYGLTNFAPEHMARLAELADKVAEVGRSLPRMPTKSAEPAHVFRVPLK